MFTHIMAAFAAPVAAVALQSALQQDLNQYLAAHAKDEHISALSLSVSLPGQPNINLTAGTRAWHSGGPITTDDLWQIGSNTKAFTAAALLQLEAQGKLTMDQTVGDWLPQYPAWKNVTIRRLLDMTSGIQGYDNVPAMGRAFTTIDRRFTPPVLVGFIDPAYPGAPAPTHGYDYSNTNYILAGMIIERATGNSYGTELERRFFKPLGLADTFYSPNVYAKAVTNRMVSGYFYNNGPGNESFAQFYGKDMRLGDVSWAGAAGAIVSTPDDLIKWVRALYAGDILAPQQRRELESIVSTKTGMPIAGTSAQDPEGFGLGVVQLTRPPLGTFWFYEGSTLGYRMVHVYLPQQDVVIAFAINSQPTHDHAGDLAKALWQTLHQAGKV